MSDPGMVAHGWWRWDERLGDWRMVTPVPGCLSGFQHQGGIGEDILESATAPCTDSVPSLGYTAMERGNLDLKLLLGSRNSTRSWLL
jgi:hypothetical protein